jgi:hypothetical protein
MSGIPAYLMAARKQKERERGRGWGPDFPFKVMPSIT